jgi:hypothetical protein
VTTIGHLLAVTLISIFDKQIENHGPHVVPRSVHGIADDGQEPESAPKAVSVCLLTVQTLTEAEVLKMTNSANDEKFVNVVICTSSGFFPEEGTNRVPENQKIRVQIEKANRALKLTDTTGWIATVDGRQLNIDTSYADYELIGTIEIDWGKPEGGGGYA